MDISVQEEAKKRAGQGKARGRLKKEQRMKLVGAAQGSSSS